jgi:hypothetical protein
MTKIRKRDTDTSPEILRRSTRSRGSTSTSTSSALSPEKVEMRLPTVLSKTKSVEIRSGPGAFERDFKKLKTQWKKGSIEGYGGLMATITGTLKHGV